VLRGEQRFVIRPEFSLRRGTHCSLSSRNSVLVLLKRIVHVRNFDLSRPYVFVVNGLVTLVVPLLAERTLKIACDNEPGFSVCVAFDSTVVRGGEHWIFRRLDCGRRILRRRSGVVRQW